MRKQGWEHYVFCQEHTADEGETKTEIQSCLTSRPMILITINIILTLILTHSSMKDSVVD